MYLRTTYQNHLHLKNDNYETVKKGKNDSEKLEVLVEALMYVLDELEVIKLRMEANE